jgi:CheY-like chemotaxis protein
VDDGAENRELVALVLEEQGAIVEQAENGHIGYELASKNPYDLILMDIHMPVMDGFTATRLLHQAGVRIPIVALTARVMKGFESEVEAMGCAGYVSKPVDIDRLLECVTGILGIAIHDSEAAGRVETDSGDVSSVAPAAPIYSRLANNRRFRPVIHKFGMRLEQELAAMEQALRRGDFRGLQDLAHWLKGAAGTVGFDALTEPATQLEESAAAAQRDATWAAWNAVRLLAERLVIPQRSDPEPLARQDERAEQKVGEHG